MGGSINVSETFGQVVQQERARDGMSRLNYRVKVEQIAYICKLQHE